MQSLQLLGPWPTFIAGWAYKKLEGRMPRLYDRMRKVLSQTDSRIQGSGCLLVWLLWDLLLSKEYTRGGRTLGTSSCRDHTLEGSISSSSNSQLEKELVKESWGGIASVILLDSWSHFPQSSPILGGLKLLNKFRRQHASLGSRIVIGFLFHISGFRKTLEAI